MAHTYIHTYTHTRRANNESLDVIEGHIFDLDSIDSKKLIPHLDKALREEEERGRGFDRLVRIRGSQGLRSRALCKRETCKAAGPLSERDRIIVIGRPDRLCVTAKSMPTPKRETGGGQ